MPLEYDLEYGLRLKGEGELQHKQLYTSAIVEVGSDGHDVGHDLIGWGWNLSFAAFDLSVSDQLTYEEKNGIGRALQGRETTHRYGIHAKLKPGHPRQHRWEDTTYRIFGTRRVIKEITLDIRPVFNPAEEGCTAWATASYMSEIDFRNVVQPDCLCFYMLVSQAVYDRYVWNLAHGLVNEVTITVGYVDGFYAEWSPGISTEEVKILGSDHVVQGAEGMELARIGNVGRVDLSMNAVGLIKPPRQAMEPETDYHQDEPAAEEEPQQGFRWPGRR